MARFISALAPLPFGVRFTRGDETPCGPCVSTNQFSALFKSAPMPATAPSPCVSWGGMQCVQIARHLAFPRASFGIAKVISALSQSANPRITHPLEKSRGFLCEDAPRSVTAAGYIQATVGEGAPPPANLQFPKLHHAAHHPRSAVISAAAENKKEAIARFFFLLHKYSF